MPFEEAYREAASKMKVPICSVRKDDELTKALGTYAVISISSQQPVGKGICTIRYRTDMPPEKERFVAYHEAAHEAVGIVCHEKGGAHPACTPIVQEILADTLAKAYSGEKHKESCCLPELDGLTRVLADFVDTTKSAVENIRRLLGK